MKRFAYSAIASKEFADHPLYLKTKSCLIEVKTENILTAVELAKAGVVLIGTAYFQGNHNGL